MKKPDRTEEMFQRLAAIRTNPGTEGAVNELRTCLACGMNLVAAKAAGIAGKLEIAELVPDLIAAFDRLMANPLKLDKGCVAMTEIAGALCALQYPACAVYQKGIGHVQVEPAFPMPSDTAAELRARCAAGLAQTRHPEALREAVSLLADPEPAARIGAVRAIASMAGDASELLLRLKVLTGDTSPEVLGECFSSLLALDPEHSLHLVAAQTEAENPAVCEEAILALGESRRPGAFEILRRKWDAEVTPRFKGTLLLAFAALRQDTAIGFMVSILDTCDAETASQAVSALALYRHDPHIRRRVEDAVLRRASPSLAALFQREFGPE